MQRLVVEPDFAVRQMRLGEARDGAQCRGLAGAVAPEQGDDLPFVHIEADVLDDVALAVESLEAPGREIGRLAGRARRQGRRLELRSEEHTSELQSLMRISYAVFCLKK